MIEPVLTEISQSILAKRYLIRNAQKKIIETPKGLFQRVAKFIASAELTDGERVKWESIFYTMMASCDFEPNTPCLVNAGRPDGTGQLSACFVLPVPDSMDGIFTAIRHMALVQKTGGGTGFAFSRLRPEGDFVASTSGIASGPISFMEVFDFATERIKQGGVRRGANMGILRVDHPDILKFIALKQDPAKMQNFNVSVGITDAFMLALDADKDYALIHPVTGNVVGQLSARAVWDEIVRCAHAIGDPGLWFIDRTNQADPLSAALGPVEATNPCVIGTTLIQTDEGDVEIQSRIGQPTKVWNGEEFSEVVPTVTGYDQPIIELKFASEKVLYCTPTHRFYRKDGQTCTASDLQPGFITESDEQVVSVRPAGRAPQVYCFTEPKRHRGVFNGILTGQCGEVPLREFDACCLGSINLARFYIEKTLNQSSQHGNVTLRHGSIDFDRLQKTVTSSVRFLDNMLTVNQYPIPEIAEVTAKSRKIGLGVMGWADLLIQLGVPYASPEARELAGHVMGMINSWAVDTSVALANERGPFHHWPVSRWQQQNHKPRRNSTVTVIAPTGTISMISGCSSGIEPLFALSMTRDQAGLLLHEVNPLVEKIARREGFWSDQLADVVRKTGSLATAPNVPDHWRAVFAVANELDSESHIGMQAAFQAHTEDAVSKTINLHNTATPGDVERAYLLAWQKGCKGITVYRDGCRTGQVLTAGVAPKTPEPEQPSIAKPRKTKRRVPDNGHRTGVTLSKSTPYGTVHMTLNHHPEDAEPFELFVRVGKSGSEVMAWAEAFGRAVSYLLSIPSAFSPQARLEEIARQLENIGGGDVWVSNQERVVSAPDAIAKLLLNYLDHSRTAPAPLAVEHSTPIVPRIDDSTLVKLHRAKSRSLSDLCPACGNATFTYQQRCGICSTCGHSKC